MPNLTQLRLAAREIFEETRRAVDAGNAVRRAIILEDLRLKVRGTPVDIAAPQVYAIAPGKAAVAMALALDEVLGERLGRGILATGRQYENLPDGRTLSSRWQIFSGGHPEPNEQSLAAARACFALLRRANEEKAAVIFLISGGGSAMIEYPVSDAITLADLRAANQLLVSCGASISEINAVRRAFSGIKGGRLAARAPSCDQITLIVSDVPAGEERNVASGPSLEPPNNSPAAKDIVNRYDLLAQLPPSVVRAIQNAKQSFPQYEGIREHCVLLNNDNAVEAAAEAARRHGFIVKMAPEVSDQPVEEGCRLLLKSLEKLCAKKSDPDSVVCLVSGGEFACPVRGNGMGGRNLETALRLAYSSDSNLSATVALCAGTDGVDGNSPAAGAIIDDTTMQRARAIGLDPKEFLDRSDSYSFFVALGDVIATGPTGTNVRDIRIMLA